MRTKLGTALDIFILIIGPWIIYARIIDILNNGASVYPVISIVIVTIAVILSIYNVYKVFSGNQQKDTRK